MSEITYDDFEKMEKAELSEGGLPKRKVLGKEYVVKVLKERPCTTSELKVAAEDARLYFRDGGRTSDYDVAVALDELLLEDKIEAHYDEIGRIIYGVKKNAH